MQVTKAAAPPKRLSPRIVLVPAMETFSDLPVKTQLNTAHRVLHHIDITSVTLLILPDLLALASA